MMKNGKRNRYESLPMYAIIPFLEKVTPLINIVREH
jgi:hypothetical protein